MTRSNFHRVLSCFTVTVLLLGCASAPISSPDELHHVVLLWLKEPGKQQAVSEIIAVSETFREIPGVIDVKAGTPVPSERSVVDGSYDVALLIVVEDREALQTYLDHPIHTAASRDVLKPAIERVVIYDFSGRTGE